MRVRLVSYDAPSTARCTNASNPVPREWDSGTYTRPPLTLSHGGCNLAKAEVNDPANSDSHDGWGRLHKA